MSEPTYPCPNCGAGEGEPHRDPCPYGSVNPSVLPGQAIRVYDSGTLAMYLAQAAMKFVVADEETYARWQLWTRESQLASGNTEDDSNLVMGIPLEDTEQLMSAAAQQMYTGLSFIQAIQSASSIFEALGSLVRREEPKGPEFGADDLTLFGRMSDVFPLSPDVEAGPSVDTGTTGPVE